MSPRIAIARSFTAALLAAAGCAGDQVDRTPDVQVVAVEPLLFDGFEGEAAGFWLPGDYGSGRHAPGAVTVSGDYARSGASSVRITVREGDVEQVGGSGQLTERAELDSGKLPLVGREAWYGFSFLIPPDFPAVDTRLVLAQWKQSGLEGSPLVAERYRGGRHYLTVRNPASTSGSGRPYPLPDVDPGRWNDMVFRIRFSPGEDGAVEVWMNGASVVAHRGPTASREGKDWIYNKIGLYRDRWADPMTIYFDDYAVGEAFEAVDPARRTRR